ncbi:MAG TPA: response regulator [Patescibacteria group bacterium]
MNNILVIEDEKFLANAYRLKLVSEGFTVQIASDGNEAMQKLNSFIPDLIILDLIMPAKDGFAVLADIKADLRFKHIPVLIASNLSQQEDIDKAMQLGASGFIVKSEMSLENVVTKIRSLLSPVSSPT